METYSLNNDNVIVEPVDGDHYKITDKIAGSVCFTESKNDALILGNFIALGQIAYNA